MTVKSLLGIAVGSTISKADHAPVQIFGDISCAQKTVDAMCRTGNCTERICCLAGAKEEKKVLCSELSISVLLINAIAVVLAYSNHGS